MIDGINILMVSVMIDDSLNVNLVVSFVADLNCSNCELINLHLHCYTESFYIEDISNSKQNYNTDTVSCKNAKYFFALFQ